MTPRADLERRVQALEALTAIAQIRATIAAAFEVVFVYRPGDPSPNRAANVFTDWNTLYAEVLKVQGYKVIEIQNDFDPTPTIPAGVYDLRGVLLTASFNQTSGSVVICELDDGVQFLNFRDVRNNLILRSHSTTVPVFTMENEPIIIERGGGITSAAGATVPFIRMIPGSTGAIILLTGGNIGTLPGATPTIQVDAGAGQTILLDLAANLVNGSIVGAGAAFVVVTSQSAFINTPMPILQPGVGVLVVNIFSLASLTQATGLIAGNWTPPTPTNVLDALNRLATAVSGILGAPIP
jgi:hypothetical protein